MKDSTLPLSTALTGLKACWGEFFGDMTMSILFQKKRTLAAQKAECRYQALTRFFSSREESEVRLESLRALLERLLYNNIIHYSKIGVYVYTPKNEVDVKGFLEEVFPKQKNRIELIEGDLDPLTDGLNYSVSQLGGDYVTIVSAEITSALTEQFFEETINGLSQGALVASLQLIETDLVEKGIPQNTCATWHRLALQTVKGFADSGLQDQKVLYEVSEGMFHYSHGKGCEEAIPSRELLLLLQKAFIWVIWNTDVLYDTSLQQERHKLLKFPSKYGRVHTNLGYATGRGCVPFKVMASAVMNPRPTS